MNLLFIVVSIGFYLWIIQNILFWVYLWQHNDYNYARMYAHLRETLQGRSIYLSYFSYYKIFLILIYGYIVLNPDFLAGYQFLVGSLFVFQGIVAIKKYSSHTLYKPKLTLKAFAIFIVPLAVVTILYLVPLAQEKYFWLLLIDKSVFLVCAFLVFIFSFPTNLYHDFYIDKAVGILKKYNKITVVGITGSYGKSSTKEFAYQILNSKFNVVKTTSLPNTAFGIAKTINDKVNSKTQILLAEMGMYSKNDIASISQIIKPKIGIITGISAQHASLTGGISSTINSKFKLILSLPRDGLALFNGNNQYSYTMYKKAKKNKVLYGSSTKHKINIKAYNIKQQKRSIVFDVLLDNKVMHFTSPLIGTQNIDNILPGIYLASSLGMKAEDIKKAVGSLSPLHQTMNRKPSINGAMIIDDTINTDPDAILAALEYMKLFKDKKILILQPMIELGKNADKIHYEIAKKISKVVDFLFLTNSNFYKSIFTGIVDGDGECYVKVGNTKQIAKFLLENCSSDDVVVFEGKEAENVLEEVL